MIDSASPLTGFLTDTERTTRASLGEEAWWFWFDRGWQAGIDAET